MRSGSARVRSTGRRTTADWPKTTAQWLSTTAHARARSAVRHQPPDPLPGSRATLRQLILSTARRWRGRPHALSRLSRPHIAHLLDFEPEDGVEFLVMELVTGPSLSEKLHDGPLPESVLRAFSSPGRPRPQTPRPPRPKRRPEPSWAASPACSGAAPGEATRHSRRPLRPRLGGAMAFYSSRSAAIGETRAARHAGTPAASAATAHRPAAARRTARGSVGATP
jgi:hypothetical protein